MQHALRFFSLAGLSLFLLLLFTFPVSANSKLVIANGGASGYLMPNNLPSLAMAISMQPDSIKIDLMLTKDNQLIVFSSSTLEKNTNVAERFLEKKREDGSYHVIDFNLDEIKQLSLKDPTNHFPADLSLQLSIPTFQEMLTLVRGLEKTLVRSIPIVVEPKQAWLYRKEGVDINQQVLTTLKEYNYTGSENDIILLSFDAQELKRMKKELMPQMQMNIQLIQLIDSNTGTESMVEEWGEWVSYNYDWMFSNSGLHSIGRYAAGIGLHKSMLADNSGALLLSDFITDTHQLGMTVYTFPVNKNDQSTSPFVKNFTEELEFYYFTVGVD